MEILRSISEFGAALRNAGKKTYNQYANAVSRIAMQEQIATTEQFWAEKDTILEMIEGNSSYSTAAKSNYKTYVRKYLEYLAMQPYVNEAGNTVEYSHKRAHSHVNDSTSIAPFTEELADIDILAATGYEKYDYHWIKYDSRVAECEKIPGLVEFINEEARRIYYMIRDMFPFSEFRLIHPAESLKLILSPEKKISEYGKPFDYSKLESLINRTKAIGSETISVAEIEEIMGKTLRDTKLGEYGNNTITIFYRVLDSTDVFTYMSDVAMALAHEMMHAYHHMMTPDTYNSNTMKSKRVKEAAADFFSFYYLISEMSQRDSKAWEKALSTESILRAKGRCGDWESRLKYDWPYSYARYFMIRNGFIIPNIVVINTIENNRHNAFIEKLSYVLHTSITSMNTAYDVLVDIQGTVSKMFDIGTKNIDTNGVNAFITIKADKVNSMTEQEVESYFYKGGNLNSFNKKETLMPIYLIAIMNQNKDKWLSIEEIQKQLYCDMYDYYGNDYEDSNLPNKNTIRRQLHTLYLKESNFYAMKVGKKFLYMASDHVPSGALSNNDLILNGANNPAVLATSYLMDILYANKNSWLSANELFSRLNSGPYRSKPIGDAKKIRRDLNTLVRFKENIYCKTDGHNLFYSCRDHAPKGYCTEEYAYEAFDDYNE